MVFRWRFMRRLFQMIASLGLTAAVGVAAPETPSVSQGTQPNPVADEVALTHRRQLAGKAEGAIDLLPGVITVYHPVEQVGYAWDPLECRVLFAWRGKEMSDLRFVAEGPAPFAATIGAWGPPDYFGYRMVEGGPEFLYYYGRLGVAEKIRPKADGSGLEQHWEVSQADHGLQVVVPERWVPRVKASTGSWSDNVLQLAKASPINVSLVWTWSDDDALPEPPAAWKQRFSPPPPPKPEEAPSPRKEPAPSAEEKP